MADLSQQSVSEKLLEQAGAKEMERADAIAKLVVDFSTDEEGRELANVHTSEGFQEIYDYKGDAKKRWRLERRKEQVCRNLDPRT